MSGSRPRRIALRRAGTRGVAILAACAAAVGASALGVPAASAAPPAATITVDAPSRATEGTKLAVTVSAADLADLYAYSLVLEYDPTNLKFDANSIENPGGGFSAESTEDG